MGPELPVVTVNSRAEWFRWLAEHGTSEPGCWLRMAKKGTGVPTLTWDEAVEGALCHGWIDGQRAAEDGTYFRQRFTPSAGEPLVADQHRPRDGAHGIRGDDRGRTPRDRGGEGGRSMGRGVRGSGDGNRPDDLRAALDADPVAAAFFETLTGANRFAILYRVQEAKRPETRAARIATFVTMCREGQTVH